MVPPHVMLSAMIPSAGTLAPPSLPARSTLSYAVSLVRITLPSKQVVSSLFTPKTFHPFWTRQCPPPPKVCSLKHEIAFFTMVSSKYRVIGLTFEILAFKNDPILHGLLWKNGVPSQINRLSPKLKGFRLSSHISSGALFYCESVNNKISGGH